MFNPVRKSITPKIQKKIREAREKGYSSIKIPGKIELIITNDANSPKLQNWDKEKNTSHINDQESKFSSLGIPNPQPDKALIENKCRIKYIQFNKIKPNALVIKLDNLFDKKDMKKIKSLIHDLEQCVYDFDEILIYW